MVGSRYFCHPQRTQACGKVVPYTPMLDWTSGTAILVYHTLTVLCSGTITASMIGSTLNTLDIQSSLYLEGES